LWPRQLQRLGSRQVQVSKSVTGRFAKKRKIVFGTYCICSTMKAREALVLGILLLLAGAFLYAFSGVVITVYTVWSDSYWTYYEFQHNIHNEYQCQGGLGVSSLCTFLYYFAYGGAGALSFAGAAIVAVSFYRLIEGPRALPHSPSPLRLCPKSRTFNPLTSKYCSECATKLT